ncbi:MAG: cupin domain-containing protein [Nitrospirota bacterium]
MAKMKNRATTQENTAPSCDWRRPTKRAVGGNKNRLCKHKGSFTWSGVKTDRYKQKEGGWSSIVRNVLIGENGETARFHLRYFEIAPGGFSSLEQHSHEHVVVCIRGKGKIRMGRKVHTINYLDTAYVAPNTVHQLTNPYDEPFGFFCIVNAKRDRPKLVKAVSKRK